MGDQADHAFVGVNFLVGNRAAQIDHRLAECLGHFGLVLRMDHDIRPGHECVAHILWQSHDIKEHRNRQWPAKCGVEIAFARIDKPADNVDGALADQPFQLLDPGGAKQWIDDVAIIAVVRRIDFLRDEKEIIVRVASELAGIQIAEDVRISQNMQAVFVLGQVP